MPIWKTTVTATISVLRLAAAATSLEQATYRVPVVDHHGRTVQ